MAVKDRKVKMNRQNLQNNKKYMSPEGIAEYFGFSESFVYKTWKKWDVNGVRCLKAGKKVLINVQQLEKYLTV